MPFISVVIPALNEEKYIANALSGLKKQSFKDFEVIVADGNSTDNTRQIAKKYGAKVIIEKRRGMAMGRNTGAKHAKGKILVFLDADTKPSRDLLKVYSRAFVEGTVAATGPILPLEKVKGDVKAGYEFVSISFVKFSILVGQPNIVGSNFAVKRDVFERVGRFNGKLQTYEDWDLSNKLKKVGRIVYLDRALVWTSARRVLAWGVWGYFVFHVGNMLRYYLIKKPKGEYPVIR